MNFGLGKYKKKYEKPKELVRLRDELDRAYSMTSRVKMDFLSLGIENVKVKKNEWIDLPDSVARKVRIMGLHTSENYTSVLVHYLPYGFIKPHFHEISHETIEVLEGSIKNIVNKQQYDEGDVVFIPKGEKHHIIGVDGLEVYMYVKFSANKKNITPVETEVKNWKKYKEA